MSADAYRRTVTISGSTYHVTDMKGKRFTSYEVDRTHPEVKASCSWKRSPEAIVRDCLRRVLDSYNARWSAYMIALADHDRDLRKRRDVLEDLAGVVGAKLSLTDGTDRDFWFSLPTAPDYYGDVMVATDGTIRLDLRSLSHTQARAVLDALVTAPSPRCSTCGEVRHPGVRCE